MLLLNGSSLSLDWCLLWFSRTDLDNCSLFTLLLGHDLLYLSVSDLLEHVFSGHLVDDRLLLFLYHLFCLDHTGLLFKEETVLVESVASFNLLEVWVRSVSKLLLPCIDPLLLQLLVVDQALLLASDPLGKLDLVVLDLEFVPCLEVLLSRRILPIKGLLKLSLSQSNLVVKLSKLVLDIFSLVLVIGQLLANSINLALSLLKSGLELIDLFIDRFPRIVENVELGLDFLSVDSILD